MKKLFIPVFSLISLTGAAVAADLPSHKAPTLAPEPTPMWTGFYAGLNVGGGAGYSNVSSYGFPIDPWAHANDASHAAGQSILPLNPWSATSSGILLSNYGSTGINQAGVIGGLQFGYNKQVTEKFVVGVETDFQGASLSGNNTFSGAGTDNLNTSFEPQISSVRTSFLQTSVSSGLNWFGTVRGRIGYLISPELLVYATGGLTYGDVYANVQNNGLSSYNSLTAPATYGGVYRFAGYAPILGNKGQQSNLLIGWNVGGGAEWIFSQRWSIKAEAFYYNLGSWNLPTTVYGGAKDSIDSLRYPLWVSSNNTKVNYDGVVARVGVNYHFNLANVAPVVAKF